MKNQLLYFISSLLVLSFLFSCSKDKKDEPKPVIPEKLDGDWLLNYVRKDVIRGQQVIPVSESIGFQDSLFYTFTPPSAFTERIDMYTGHATYEVSNDSLIIISLSIASPIPDSIYNKTYYKIEKLEAGELVLSQVVDQSNFDKTVVTSKFIRY